MQKDPTAGGSQAPATRRQGPLSSPCQIALLSTLTPGYFCARTTLVCPWGHGALTPPPSCRDLQASLLATMFFLFFSLSFFPSCPSVREKQRQTSRNSRPAVAYTNAISTETATV